MNLGGGEREEEIPILHVFQSYIRKIIPTENFVTKENKVLAVYIKSEASGGHAEEAQLNKFHSITATLLIIYNVTLKCNKLNTISCKRNV